MNTKLKTLKKSVAGIEVNVKGLHSRKFKEGICSGCHLAVTNGGELLYLRFSYQNGVGMSATDIYLL